jgi:hypothetical protein
MGQPNVSGEPACHHTQTHLMRRIATRHIISLVLLPIEPDLFCERAGTDLSYRNIGCARKQFFVAYLLFPRLDAAFARLRCLARHSPAVPASLNDLPVELVGHVFKFLLTILRMLASREGKWIACRVTDRIVAAILEPVFFLKERKEGGLERGACVLHSAR